jgi:hypothetical protein
MHGIGVSGRMNGNRRNSHLARSPDETQCDFSPVSNDEFVDFPHVPKPP